MNRHIKILDIFYGNKCNLACSNCDTHSDYLRSDEFDPSLDNIKESIILANEKFDVENWSVLGGEPFLYIDKVVEIIKFLRTIEPNKTIFFPTNGMLLEKNLDLAAEIINKYNVWMQVCNHVAGFEDTKQSEKIKNAVHLLAEKAGISKSKSSTEWWYQIMKYDGGTQGWQDYLKRKQLDINDTLPNETAWIKGNKGIAYMESRQFQAIHFFNELGQPKPYNSQDPEQSYWNSCPSCFCSLLYDKKIYKCAALGTLKNFLIKNNSLDDPEWKKYLDYNPINLNDCSDKDIQQFADSHYSHIAECSMCPSNAVEIRKNENNVLPIKFSRNKKNI